MIIFFMCLCVSQLTIFVTAQSNQQAIYLKSLGETAVSAYLYFYPLVTMEVTRRQSSLSGIRENVFTHVRTYPTASSLTIVRPNFDTLYSAAWLDLTDGPLLMSLPDTLGRYYLMPVYDMWTDVVGSPGWRTTGTVPREFAILPPGCTGSLPKGVEPIDVPTPYAWIIGRLQTNGVDDYAAVNALQNKLKLTRLHGFECPKPMAWSLPLSIQALNMTSAKPLNLVNNMTAQQFFEFASYLWNINPPHLPDWSHVQVYRKLGIQRGQRLQWANLSLTLQTTLQNGVIGGLNIIRAASNASKTLVNGWNMNLANVGVFGNDFLVRAVTAAIGLGANQPQDAVYPVLQRDSQGNSPDGSKCYQMTFPFGGTPPSMAYWSVTMYNGLGFAVSNSINRYALHSWDTNYGMTYNPDGSLIFYIQSQQPSNASLVPNWLPSPPSGSIGITMRIYAPFDSVATYQPPPLVPANCV